MHSVVDKQGDTQFPLLRVRVRVVDAAQARQPQIPTRHPLSQDRSTAGSSRVFLGKASAAAQTQELFRRAAAQVTPDYWHYVSWRASHRLFSSMLGIFATQSLLSAVGIGAQRALPAAAAINWVLKDGLGRLGRLGVAAAFGQSFDADVKVPDAALLSLSQSIFQYLQGPAQMSTYLRVGSG